MGSPIKELPSETFRRQCYATFQEDRSGIRLRDMLGVDNLMWASDYPHSDTTFPDSKKVIDATFAGVPEADKRKMICDNAAKLYGFTK
jgi:predicted TIM-barrel fold metal-dependent hydrolase